MGAYIWSSVAQMVVILLIILGAFVLPEPKYTEVMQAGPWTAEKSAASLNNKIIYARRFIRRGVTVGLGFGLCAALLTWIIG